MWLVGHLLGGSRAGRPDTFEGVSMNRDKFTRAYTYWADIYCLECGEKLPAVDPENNERYPVASWQLAEFVEDWGGHPCAWLRCGGCGVELTA